MYKKIFILILLSLFLTGCNTTRKTVMTCNGTLDGLDETFIFEANNDNIQSQKELFSFKVEDLGYSLNDYKKDHSIIDKEELKDFVYQTMFNGIHEVEGISIDIKDNEDTLDFTITIDYSTVDKNTLIKAGIIDNETVSLEKTINDLKNKGIDCEEQLNN